MTLLEAMSSGCPVVCSNSGSIPEVAGEAAEFFDPLDTDDMGRAILKVARDESLAETLRSNGTLRLGEFSWQKCAQETMRVYQRLTE